MNCNVTGKCPACGWFHHATETQLVNNNGKTAHEIKPYLYPRCINCKAVMPYKWSGQHRKTYDEAMQKQDEEDTRTLEATITDVIMSSEETSIELILNVEGRTAALNLPQFRGSDQARAFYSHIERNLKP